MIMIKTTKDLIILFVVQRQILREENLENYWIYLEVNDSEIN